MCQSCQITDDEVAVWSQVNSYCAACERQGERAGRCSCGKVKRRVANMPPICTECERKEALRRAKPYVLLHPTKDEVERIIWRSGWGHEGRGMPEVFTATLEQWRQYR